MSNNLNGKSPEFEKVHVNVGFEDAASDHDPLLARFTLNTAVVIDGTPTTSIDQSSFYSFTPNVTDGDSLVSLLRISLIGPVLIVQRGLYQEHLSMEM